MTLTYKVPLISIITGYNQELMYMLMCNSQINQCLHVQLIPLRRHHSNSLFRTKLAEFSTPLFYVHSIYLIHMSYISHMHSSKLHVPTIYDLSAHCIMLYMYKNSWTTICSPQTGRSPALSAHLPLPDTQE